MSSSSDSDNDDDDDDDGSTVFVLEHFQLCMAEIMVGKLDEEFSQSLTSYRQLQRSSNNNNSSSRSSSSIGIRLQWRSPLLMEIDPLTFRKTKKKQTPSSKNKKKKKSDKDGCDDGDDRDEMMMDLVFLDVDFILETKLVQSKPREDDNGSEDDQSKKAFAKSAIAPPSPTTTTTKISMICGALVHQDDNDKDEDSASSSSSHYYYMKSKQPITTQYLEDHMDQHNDVLLDTASENNANAMMQAIRQSLCNKPGIQAQCRRSSSSRSGSTTNTKIEIPLFYEQDQTDPSHLTISATDTTEINPQLLGPLLANGFSKAQQHQSTIGISKDEKSLLVTKYEEWKHKASGLLKEQAAAAKEAEAAAARRRQDEKQKQKSNGTIDTSNSNGEEENQSPAAAAAAAAASAAAAATASSPSSNTGSSKSKDKDKDKKKKAQKKKQQLPKYGINQFRFNRGNNNNNAFGKNRKKKQGKK